MDGNGADIETLLDDVHRALLAGDLTALPELATLMEGATVDANAQDASTTDRLRRKAQRNGELLQATTRGLRAAHRRLQELRQATRDQMATYDGNGRRQTLGGAGRLAGRF